MHVAFDFHHFPGIYLQTKKKGAGKKISQVSTPLCELAWSPIGTSHCIALCSSALFGQHGGRMARTRKRETLDDFLSTSCLSSSHQPDPSLTRPTSIPHMFSSTFLPIKMPTVALPLPQLPPSRRCTSICEPPRRERELMTFCSAIHSVPPRMSQPRVGRQSIPLRRPTYTNQHATCQLISSPVQVTDSAPLQRRHGQALGVSSTVCLMSGGRRRGGGGMAGLVPPYLATASEPPLLLEELFLPSSMLALASLASHWVRTDAGLPQTHELIWILLADCADSHTGTACWYPRLSQGRPPHSLLSCHCIFAPAFSTARARFWRPGGHRTQSPASTTQAHTDGARPESVDGPASPVIAALPGLPAHQPQPITARHPLRFSRRHTRPPSFDIAFCLSSPAPPSLVDVDSTLSPEPLRTVTGWRVDRGVDPSGTGAQGAGLPFHDEMELDPETAAEEPCITILRCCQPRSGNLSP